MSWRRELQVVPRSDGDNAISATLENVVEGQQHFTTLEKDGSRCALHPEILIGLIHSR